MKRKLSGVTLLGIDCLDIDRLIQAAEICQLEFEFESIKLLTSLQSSNPNVVQISPITSEEEYSRFIIEKLDNYVDTSHVLIIQYDGFILNPMAWSDDFLKYDYIGAPWLVRNVSVKRFGFPEDLLGHRIVGNGGFSLRSKKMLSLSAKLLKDGCFQNYHPEDIVICVHNRKLFEEKGILFAPVALAQKFSFESEDNDNYSWTDQFGFHGLRWTDISKWTRAHPEYKLDNSLKAVGKKHKYT